MKNKKMMIFMFAMMAIYLSQAKSVMAQSGPSQAEVREFVVEKCSSLSYGDSKVCTYEGGQIITKGDWPDAKLYTAPCKCQHSHHATEEHYIHFKCVKKTGTCR